MTETTKTPVTHFPTCFAWPVHAGDRRMGITGGKPAVKSYETLHIPPPSSIDVILEEQARLLVEEMTGNGVGGQEIAAAGVGAGVDPDPGRPNDGEKEPEKEVPAQSQKRLDCTFYMKTGTCKFGPSCRFNHPARRTTPRVWSKRDGGNAQFSKNAMGKQKEPPLKMEPTEKKDDKVEKQTPSRRLEQEDCKVWSKRDGENSQFSKNAMGKQREPPLQKVEPTEKKDDKVEKQTPYRRLEQEDCKAWSMRDGENAQFSKNAMGKQREPPLQKVEPTEKKDDKVEKQTPSRRLEQEDFKFQQNDIGKQKWPPFKKVEQTDKKVDKVELQTSSRRLEQEDSKIAEKMSNRAISGKTGLTECKFYTTPGGCKYGNSCKYAHFQRKIDVAPIVLNFLGLPIRPGKKECPYYIYTGNCKYSVNCKFHHPDPTIANDAQGALPDCRIIGSEQHIPFGVSLPPPAPPNPAPGTFYVPTPLTAASPSYFPEPKLHPRVFPFHSSSESNDYQIHTDEYSDRRPGEPEWQYSIGNWRLAD